MKYFKNTELAKLYNVSEKSVRNWIEATRQGKLSLELHLENGKLYIANTSKNTPILEHLVSKGKKYRNSRGFKVVTPVEEFYKIYDKKQVLDILSNLTIHKEIPLQYGYLNGGAESWDHYAKRLAQEQTPNILTRTTSLLKLNASYIDLLVGNNRRVNIVDLGPGNGLPARPIIERLHEQGRLNRYIALDISQDMLDILEKNIKTWFSGEVAYEGYVRNFNEERFNDLITESYLGDDEETPVNLVFLFGGTLSNFRQPDHVLQVINSSMGPGDIFFYSGYMDTPYTRRYFDLSGTSHDQEDVQQSGLIPSLLRLDESLCDFEQLFDREKRCRFKIMKPKVDLEIHFTIENKDLGVELNKEEPILLWRHRHYDYVDIVSLLDKNDFNVLQATKSEDENFVLLMSKIKLGAQH
ncbi:MAG TPA: L-histidine N(alpha)-methyltransferase [Candidatus Saccharimonadales bacterium]